MAKHIDYYVSLNSPWTHLGAARIEAMAAAHDASLRVYPVDFGAIFAGSGGLQVSAQEGGKALVGFKGCT